VIDSEEELVVSMLPFRVAFPFGELQDFKRMLIWILEIKGFDTGRVLVPHRENLGTSRGMFDLIFSKPGISLFHIAGNDRNVLEPVVVATRVHRNRTALRGDV